MEPQKSLRLNYELTEKKLLAAAKRLAERYAESNEPISVRKVAKEAGVSLSTAYKHDCLNMIRNAIEELEK
ncbi:MAG: hypothetical protein ACI4D7_01075 [Lachnospiraceae bacterium]